MIDNLILSYLNENGKVTIPALGTLINKDGTTLFLPFLKSNDGSFSQYIMEQLPISTDEVNEIICTYAQEVTQTIDVEGEYLLEGCGILKRDINKLVYLEQINIDIEPKSVQNPIVVKSIIADSAEIENIAIESNIEPESIQNPIVVEPIIVDSTEIENEPNEVDSQEVSPSDCAPILENFNEDSEITNHTLAKEEEPNEVIAESIEIKESEQIEISTIEIATTTTTVNLQKERTSMNDIAATNRQRTFADTIVQNRTMCDIAQDNKAANNSLVNPCNTPEPQEAEVTKDIIVEILESSETQTNIETVAPTKSTSDNINISEPKSETETFCPMSESKGNETYVKSQEDQELLTRLKNSKNKKAKLYNLYETDNTAESEKVSNIYSETDKENKNPEIQEQVYTKPKKSGFDPVIIISIVAILLAAGVSIYYFMIRI